MFEFSQVLRVRSAWLAFETYRDLRIMWLGEDDDGYQYSITLVPTKEGIGWANFGAINNTMNEDAFEVDPEWPR